MITLQLFQILGWRLRGAELLQYILPKQKNPAGSQSIPWNQSHNYISVTRLFILFFYDCVFMFFFMCSYLNNLFNT